jgi:hypothetical protein
MRVLMVSLLAGCAAQTLYWLQDESSGRIGCPPDEIIVANFDNYAPRTWEATCRGRTFYCSKGLFGEDQQTACTEQLPAHTSQKKKPG